MRSSYDVVVVGAGTAGVIAAIQAGRAGAATLLIEKNGIAGGTLVAGGINYPASFHAYDKLVIAGIGWELCCRARQEVGEPPPRPRSDNWHAGAGILHFGVNPAVFAALADEMLLSAGVEILYHAMPAAARPTADGWQLSVCTKTGLRDVTAKVVVDCTADANVVTLAGLPVERNPELQAATLVVRTAGYDDKALDYEAIQRAFESEVAAGRMRHTDPGWSRGRFEFFLKGYGGNRLHITGVDGRTSEARTEAEIEGRRTMLRLLRFCRRQPGLENFVIASCAMECGIRETVTIKARKTVTVHDLESGRLWEDAVCYTFYAIDIHRADHTHYRRIEPGVHPTIPLGAMLPADGRGLLVAGRCVAGDQEANSLFRVEASCMAMGQAAGAAAALAAARGQDVAQVPITAIHALLREHGAIVPGDKL
ncbi:MAG: dihydrolipoamide dehydrogenase [Lentisphaerae bacterium ADurb.BinA184]|nr:MAG: dihydrolipoamide dehydrogenase [Lentisphaerae bacterium ADurb.BinA184]